MGWSDTDDGKNLHSDQLLDSSQVARGGRTACVSQRKSV